MGINRGINRLSWLAGLVMSFVFLFWITSGMSDIPWGRIGIAMLVVATATWGLVRLVGWVIAGFQ